MSAPANTQAIPFALASLGIATYAGMDVLMKGISIEIGAYNAMLWRGNIRSGLNMWRLRRCNQCPRGADPLGRNFISVEILNLCCGPAQATDPG